MYSETSHRLLILISGCFIKVQKNKLLSVRGSGKGQKTNKSEQTAQQRDRGWGRPGGMGRPGTAGKPSPKPHFCLAPRRHGSQEKRCQQMLKGKSNFSGSWHTELAFGFALLGAASLFPPRAQEGAGCQPTDFILYFIKHDWRGVGFFGPTSRRHSAGLSICQNNN